MMPSQVKPNVNTVWASAGLAAPVDAAKQALGFIAEIPEYDDFNGMIQQISAFQKHVNQEGVPGWDALTQYYTGGFTKANGTAYVALQDSLNNAPPALGATNAYWRDLFARVKDFATDTGAANAYVGVYAPVLTLTNGLVVGLKAANANTGATTFNGTAVVGEGHTALQGGEIVANGLCLFQYNSSIGGGSWVLISNTGGAQQVGPATKSNHALQLGQATGRLLRTTIYINVAGVLQSSVDGAAFGVASSTFTKHPDAVFAEAEIQGGGGSGGNAASTSAGNVSAGSGGSGGGWARKRAPIASFNGLTVSVGLGGGVGAVAAGGSTSFGAFLSAPGGPPGSTGANGPATNIPFGVTAGGLGTSGDINARGGMGFYALYSATALSGKGGESRFGEGAASTSGAPTTGTPGISADSYGSGGGGAANGQSVPSNINGGAGKSGVAIIKEYA